MMYGLQTQTGKMVGGGLVKNDLSLVADGENHLTYQEAIQAILDGKEVEIQDADGALHSMLPINTTLHQLTSLNFSTKTIFRRKA